MNDNNNITMYYIIVSKIAMDSHLRLATVRSVGGVDKKSIKKTR